MAEIYHNFLEPTKTVYSMWVIIAVIALFAFICTRRIREVPGPLQNLAEMAVSGLVGFYSGIMGEKKARQYFPILATFFIFIVISNYSGLLPGAGHLYTVPTSVLAVTAGLSLVSFMTIQTSGIRHHGIPGYLKTFTKPVAVLLPIMIVEQFVRPVSMALRLYGNIYGEELATETLFGLFPLVLPIVMNILSLLFCFIQAMVFSMLLGMFLNEATEDEE